MQFLTDKGGYDRAPATSNSQVEGILHFLYVAKASIKDPKEADLRLKYVGKADNSIKSRLDAHGHGMVQPSYEYPPLSSVARNYHRSNKCALNASMPCLLMHCIHHMGGVCGCKHPCMTCLMSSCMPKHLVLFTYCASHRGK